MATNRVWAEEILEEILLSDRHLRNSKVTVPISTHHRDAIVAAAHERGIPIGAYMMRAACAFAMHDLGFDVSWEDFMKNEASFMATWDPRRSEIHDGAGFGPWAITGLAGEGDDGKRH